MSGYVEALLFMDKYWQQIQGNLVERARTRCLECIDDPAATRAAHLAFRAPLSEGIPF